jgi:hypothetical protein
MNDDIPRSIYSVCAEIRDVTAKRPLHFFRGRLLVIPRIEGRTVRSFHDLYHHMSSVIVDEVSFRIFPIRVRPFAIWIVFILPVFERRNFPGADQLLLQRVGLSGRSHRGSFGSSGQSNTSYV